MAAYEYRALDAAGRPRKGILAGDSPRQVRSQLRAQGLHPLRVDTVQERHSGRRYRPGQSVSTADLALMTRQLATLLRAGMPLEEALRALAEQAGSRRLQAVVTGVRADINEGIPLHQALDRYPSVFPEMYRVMVETGEASGKLEEVLDRLATYTEQRRLLQQKLGVAMIYPVLVMLVSVLVVFVLLIYVIPEVVRVFEQGGQSLPALTRWLIAASDFFQKHGLAVAACVALLWPAGYLLLSMEKVRWWWHRLLLDLPLAGRIYRTLNAARLARSLAILTRSGTPLLEALRIGGRILKNLPLRAAVTEAAVAVREGGTLHVALAASGYLPPLFIHMLAAGERSGELEEMLERAAGQQENELETAITTLTALIEPLIILVMGAVVLAIVLAILLPVFEMNRLVTF